MRLASYKNQEGALYASRQFGDEHWESVTLEISLCRTQAHLYELSAQKNMTAKRLSKRSITRNGREKHTCFPVLPMKTRKQP